MQAATQISGMYRTLSANRAETAIPLPLSGGVWRSPFSIGRILGGMRCRRYN